MSTLEILRAAAEQARRIDAALERLDQRRRELAAVNEHVKAGQVWTPKFLVKSGGAYGYDSTIELPVPGRYLQQWAVDQVRRAERAVVQAGGVVPPDPYRNEKR